MNNQANIIIIGMPGAGKSSVAQALAQICGWPNYDTDLMILEQTGQSSAELILSHGEAAFRLLEQQIVAEATAKHNCIIT